MASTRHDITIGDTPSKKRSIDDVQGHVDDASPKDPKRAKVAENKETLPTDGQVSDGTKHIVLQANSKEQVVHLHLHIKRDENVQKVRIELANGVLGSVALEESKSLNSDGATTTGRGNFGVFDRLKSATMTIVNGIVIGQQVVCGGNYAAGNGPSLHLSIAGSVGGSVSTVTGDVECLQVDGSISSTSGDIECNGSVGSFIKTVSGDVVCGGVVGGSVTSVSGDIYVVGQAMGKIRTTSGSISTRPKM